MKTAVFCLGLALSATGCVASLDDEGTVAADMEAEQEQAAMSSTRVHHVVLLSGGFGSCNPSGVQGVLPTEFGSILSDIEAKSGSRPTIIRTCFGGVGDAERMDYLMTEGSLTLSAGGTTVQNLETLISSKLDAKKPSRLDAYGHSHGGWLVGRVVQDLGRGTDDAFTLNVVLSDAISRKLCTPQVVISGDGREECGRFPRDLDPTRIRANVRGYFGTAYQNLDWLHSTAVPGVENIPFTPGLAVQLTAQNHRALYTLPLSWGGFRSRFQYR